MICYDSTGAKNSKSISAPISWSGGANTIYFKMSNNQILQSGSYDTVGGKRKYFVELYDSNAQKLWGKEYGFITYASSVQNQNILAYRNTPNKQFLLFSSSGAILKSFNDSMLLGSFNSVSNISPIKCGEINNNYWMLFKSYPSDTTILVVTDTNQKIIYRRHFLSNYAMGFDAFNGHFIWFKSRLDSTKTKNLDTQIEVYDSNFTFIRSFSRNSSLPSGFASFQMHSGYIYTVLQHFPKSTSYTSFSEVQKWTIDGQLKQRNFYRFWLDKFGDINWLKPVSAEFISLDVCSDNGYLLTGFISNGYDRRVIAVKLDSNGLGRDTLRIPAELLPLTYWDSTFIIADTANHSNFLNENQKENVQFKIFPNPAKSTISIEVKEDVEIHSIQILSIENGQKVLDIAPSNLKEIDISSLPNGIYVIRIVDFTGNQFNEAFVKESD